MTTRTVLQEEKDSQIKETGISGTAPLKRNPSGCGGRRRRRRRRRFPRRKSSFSSSSSADLREGSSGRSEQSIPTYRDLDSDD